MSVDWEKYSTAIEARDRARNPAVNAVVSFVAGEVRQIPQQVEHDPLPHNEAHSDIIGDKTPEVRVKLRRILSWEILFTGTTTPPA